MGDEEDAREAVKETVRELVREHMQKIGPYLVLLFILFVPFFHAIFTEGSPPLDFQRSLWHPIVILSTVLCFLNACFLGVRYFKLIKAVNREWYKLPEYSKLSKPINKMEIKVDRTATTLLYILSFFIPFAGFIVGAIYLSKEEEHYKHIGKNCLIFSVMNIILGLLIIVALSS